MKDEKIVESLRTLGYEPFKDDATPDEVNGYNSYCVYYLSGIRKQDQHICHQIIEFVFVNEMDDFDEIKIIDTLESIGLSMHGEGEYGRLKKVAGGDIVNSLTLITFCFFSMFKKVL